MTARERAEKLAGPHYKCDDTWYSCPLSENGLCEHDASDGCTCGRDQRVVAIERALLDTIEEFRTECMCLHAKLMGRLDLKGDQQFLSGEISALNKYAAEIRKMGDEK